MNEILIAKNQIEITQVDSPHKFWYKRCHDSQQERLLNQLEESLKKYASDLIEWGEHLLPVQYGDVAAAYHPVKEKWIRGKVGKIKRSDKKNEIQIWAIDYGCTLTVESSGQNVVLLNDQELACRHPINVNIGGLADISPAKSVSFIFNSAQTLALILFSLKLRLFI